MYDVGFTPFVGVVEGVVDEVYHFAVVAFWGVAVVGGEVVD